MAKGSGVWSLSVRGHTLTSGTEFLVGVRGFSGEGMGLLKKLFAEVNELCEELTSSSVYRVKKTYSNSKTIHDLRSVSNFDGLVAAFRGKTKYTAHSLVDELYDIEKHFRSESLHRSANLTLFCFGQETIMTPRLTLPFPDFHLRADELIPVSEIWGDYHHPVLGESLSSLGRIFLGEDWGEFVAQGLELREI